MKYIFKIFTIGSDIQLMIICPECKNNYLYYLDYTKSPGIRLKCNLCHFSIPKYFHELRKYT